MIGIIDVFFVKGTAEVAGDFVNEVEAGRVAVLIKEVEVGMVVAVLEVAMAVGFLGGLARGDR